MRAVLFDGLGTLLQLREPWRSLERRLLAERLVISPEQAQRAFASEIAYYLEHHLEGTDERSVARLRTRCAGVLHDALPADVRDALLPAALREVMLDCLRFDVYPEAPAALRRLRERALKLVVVSNWDVSLHQVIRDTGLAEFLDGVLCSAEVGEAKPARAVFERALEIAGVAAAQATHVGDSLVNDVRGAHEAGLNAVLLRRDEVAGVKAPADVPVIGSLTELLA